MTYSSRSSIHFIITSNEWEISYFGANFSADLLRCDLEQSEALPDELSTTCSGSEYMTNMKKSISYNDENDPKDR